MSGPQGSDPTGWQGQDQPGSGPAAGSEQPPAWGQPAAGSETPAWQPQAYPQPYQYGQPQGYPAAPPYGAPGEYNPAAYQQPGYGQPQYGQYGPPPQYGQYPQPGQYPGQYPQYGMPGVPEAGQKSMKAAGVLLGALGAVALLAVLILGFWKPGFFVTTKLDVNKAQQGVQQILTDESNGYGAKNVKDVKCNNGANPTVKKGDTFTCEVSIDGTKRQVTVTFQDDKGTYEVGRPK